MGSDFVGDLKCSEQILSWENSGPAEEILDGAVGFLEEYHRLLLLVFLHAYFFCFLWSELFIFSVCPTFCSAFTYFRVLVYSLV